MELASEENEVFSEELNSYWEGPDGGWGNCSFMMTPVV
jgi:hypothetical protein